MISGALVAIGVIVRERYTPALASASNEQAVFMLASIDPVCGDPVQEDTALKAAYRGREYFFDSEACLHRFESEPERYVEQAA